jgi:endonuclease/exonuclease/phosphatase family metal-dependent hydrolase
MKKIPFVNPNALIIIITFTVFSSFAQYPDTAKIMTYNIYAESDTHDITKGSGSYANIDAVIKAINPDIAGLQKLDSCNDRNGKYVLKWLAEQENMQYEFAVAQKNFKNGSYGIGFLMDKAPLSVRKLWIPKTGSEEDRAALEIGITMAGERVRVIVTHLDYSNAGNRTSEIKKILTWIDSAGSKTIPAVIMADFNASPTDDCMKLLTDSGFVFVKGKNGVILDSTQKINHILYRPENRWNVLDASNPHYSASNRNPLWANMKLLNPVSVTTTDKNKFPFNPRATICGQEVCYTLPYCSRVSIRLYNASGKKIRTILDSRSLEAGRHSYFILKNGLARDLYFLETSINGVKTTGKIMLER